MQPVGYLDAPHGPQHPVGHTARQRKLLPPELAEQLLVAHQATGLSYRQIAPYLGVHYSYWRRLTVGERCPSRPVAHRIIQVLDLPDTVIDGLLDEAVDRRYYPPR